MLVISGPASHDLLIPANFGMCTFIRKGRYVPVVDFSNTMHMHMHIADL